MEKELEQFSSPEILYPSVENYERAANILSQGGLGVWRISSARNAYGFGVNVADKRVVEKMNKAKQRALGQIPIFGLLPEQLEKYADLRRIDNLGSEIKELFKTISIQNVFLIVPPTNEIPPHLITYGDDGPTIAFMLFANELYKPSVEIYTRLLRKRPEAILGGSSANIHKREMCTSVNAVKEQLGSKIDFIIDMTSMWPDQRGLTTPAPMIVLPVNTEESFIVYRGGDVFINASNQSFSLSEGPLPKEFIDLLSETL